VKEQVAEIVAAYFRKNIVAPGDIPGVITQVYQSFAALGRAPAEPPEGATPKPAVSIRRSVADDAITCLECGARGTIMRRHLKAAHSLTPEEYRHRWSLPASYPMVAPNYAVRRSALAKAFGLGKLRNASKRRRGRASARPL
jgi:predicted transcriptional regulator